MASLSVQSSVCGCRNNNFYLLKICIRFLLEKVYTVKYNEAVLKSDQVAVNVNLLKDAKTK